MIPPADRYVLLVLREHHIRDVAALMGAGALHDPQAALRALRLRFGCPVGEDMQTPIGGALALGDLEEVVGKLRAVVVDKGALAGRAAKAPTLPEQHKLIVAIHDVSPL